MAQPVPRPQPRLFKHPTRRFILILAVCCVLCVNAAEWMASKSSLANLGLYIKKYLDYPTNTTTQAALLMKCLACLASIAGAWLADAYLGKFKVIMAGTCVTFCSLAGLSLVNLLPAVRPSAGAQLPPAGINVTRGLAWTLIAVQFISTGMTYPCVQGYGADQFDERSPEEVRWRSSYFYIKHMLAAATGLFSSLVLVGITEYAGYGISYLVSTGIYAFALAVFIAGAVLRIFCNMPPLGESPFSRFCRVMLSAWRKRNMAMPHDPALHAQLLDQFDDPAGCSCLAGCCLSSGFDTGLFRRRKGAAAQQQQASTAVDPFAEEQFGPSNCCPGGVLGSEHEVSAAKVTCLDHAAIESDTIKPSVPLADVIDTKAFFSLMPIFITMCIYEIGNDMLVVLPLTGDSMDRRSGNYTVPAATMGVFTGIFSIITALSYDRIIVPLFYRRGIEVSKLWTIGAGYFIGILALIAAASVEHRRHRTVRETGLRGVYYKELAVNPQASWEDPKYIIPMSIWWQAIPYSLLGICDTLVTTGFMDLAYSQVSAANKSLAIALAVVANAGGGFLAAALNAVINHASHGDKWLANNPLEGHVDRYFFVNAVITAAGFLLFLLCAARFQPRLIQVEEAVKGSSAGGAAEQLNEHINAEHAEGLSVKHVHANTKSAGNLSSAATTAAADAAATVDAGAACSNKAAGELPFGSEAAKQRASSGGQLTAPRVVSPPMPVHSEHLVHHLMLRRNTLSAAMVPCDRTQSLARIERLRSSELGDVESHMQSQPGMQARASTGASGEP